MDKIKLRQIDFEKLLNFLTVVREGSISKAADASGVQRRTYYHDLSVLEAAFQTKLYLGGKKNFVLTEEGKKLADFCKISLAELNVVTEGPGAFTHGRLAIHTTIGISTYYFTKVLKTFRQAYPEIYVDLLAGPKFFSPSQYDVDLSIGPYIPDSGGLSQHVLAPCDYGYFASTEYLAAHGIPHTEADLKNHYILGYAGQHFLPQAYVNKDNTVIQSNSYPTLLALCEQGLGISSLALKPTLGYMKSNPHRNPQLVRVLPDVISEKDNIYYAFSRYTPKEKAIRYICDLLKDCMAQEDAQLAEDGREALFFY